MKRSIRWGAMLAAATLFAGTVAINAAHVRAARQGDDGRPRGCSAATLKGDYGIQISGTRPSAPGGPIETVIGVVWRRYDGQGQFTQIDNVKGSISGITPNRFGSGTYVVNEDCTGFTTGSPGPGIFLENHFVIVKGGQEVREIVASPQPVMVSDVQIKIDVP